MSHFSAEGGVLERSITLLGCFDKTHLLPRHRTAWRRAEKQKSQRSLLTANQFLTYPPIGDSHTDKLGDTQYSILSHMCLYPKAAGPFFSRKNTEVVATVDASQPAQRLPASHVDMAVSPHRVSLSFFSLVSSFCSAGSSHL